MYPHTTPNGKAPASFRLEPILHMQSGETVTLLAEALRPFEERAVFGPAAHLAERQDAATPAQWLADQIETIAISAHHRSEARPIIIASPLVALVHPDTPLLCDTAIRRTPVLPQEICLEVSDSDLATPHANAQKGIEALRRTGFRVSLNATKSNEAPLNSAMRLLLDNIRIDARRLDSDEELYDRVEAATASGMSVIAQNARWRDGEYLASLGIDLALRPRADA